MPRLKKSFVIVAKKNYKKYVDNGLYSGENRDRGCFLYKYKSVIKIYIPIDKVGKTCYDIYTNQEGR
jgi:hypothetical protein